MVSTEQTNGLSTLETLTLEPNEPQRLARLCGPFDQNLKQIEKRLGIEIRNRGNAFHLAGDDDGVARAGRLLHRLYRETLGEEGVTPEQVHLHLQEARAEVPTPPCPLRRGCPPFLRLGVSCGRPR